MEGKQIYADKNRTSVKPGFGITTTTIEVPLSKFIYPQFLYTVVNHNARQTAAWNLLWVIMQPHFLDEKDRDGLGENTGW